MFYTATNGQTFPQDAPMTYTYNGPGNAVDTITATWKGKVFVLTLTYTGTNVTSNSGWVMQ